ncbi:MAG: energy transducer TonB [Burkholderiales bacterium]|nr:energy transducer TonB [Burkholderiales bacterium]
MSALTDKRDTVGAPSLTARSRGRYLLPACIVASAALHALAVVLWPSPVQDHDAQPLPVLDVVLVQPPPVAAPEPAPAPPVPRESARRPAVKSKVPPEPAIAQKMPALESTPQSFAAPDPQRVPAPVTAAPHPEKEVPAGAASAAVSQPDVAGTRTTSPVFNATYLYNPPPSYPLVSRRLGEQGTVTLRVLVTREGLPVNIDVERSSGSRHLDRAAMETVRTWRFAPVRKGAQPVEAWVLVPVAFRLEDAS